MFDEGLLGASGFISFTRCYSFDCNFFFNAWLQSIFKEKQRPDEERLLLLLGIGLDLYSRDFTESRETRVSNLRYERAHFSEVKKQFKSCK